MCATVYSGFREWASPWRVLQLVMCITLITSLSMRFMMQSRCEKWEHHYTSLREEKYLDTFELGWGILREKSFLSISLVPAYLGLLRFCAITKQFGPLISIIIPSILDLLSYLVILFTFLFGYMIAFTVRYGDSVDNYASVYRSFIALARMIFGDFDLKFIDKEAGALQSFLGPLLAFSFIIFGSLLLLNILIANLSYLFETMAETRSSAVFVSFSRSVFFYIDRPSWMPLANIVTFWPRMVLTVYRARQSSRPEIDPETGLTYGCNPMSEQDRANHRTFANYVLSVFEESKLEGGLGAAVATKPGISKKELATELEEAERRLAEAREEIRRKDMELRRLETQLLLRTSDSSPVTAL
jgi:hypothetical protein